MGAIEGYWLPLRNLAVAGTLFGFDADRIIAKFVNTGVVCNVIDELLVPHNKTGCKVVSMKTGQKAASHE